MALKKSLLAREKLGLTQEEVNVAEAYLRKHKTRGAVPQYEAMKLYEMYMVGCSFNEIHSQFPQYPVAAIVLTCALRGWAYDREKMLGSLQDRVQTKVVKSVIDQVDFLTLMLSVANADNMDAMRKYIADPKKNPKPDIRVQNIKEYREVVETLHKLVAGATNANQKQSAMLEVLSPERAKAKKAIENTKNKKPLLQEAKIIEDDDVADFLAGAVK